MADAKITSLPATTTLLSTDILTVVTDPSGTPTNKKITTANLASAALGIGAAVDVPITGAGKGLIVTTPNGLHTYRIAISNAGEITSEQLT